MRHPAVPLAVALLVGTSGGVLAPVAAPPCALAAVVWLAGTLTWICASQGGVRILALTAAAAAAACGWALGSVAVRDALDPEIRAVLTDVRGESGVSDRPGDPVALTGRLLADAVAGPEGLRLAVEALSVDAGSGRRECRGGVLITVAGNATDGRVAAWTKGRSVRAPVLLRRPSRYLNAGVPDHEQALLRRGIALVGTVKSAWLVELVGLGSVFDEGAAAARRWARRVLDRQVGAHDVRSSAIVRAILIGDRTGLDDETETRLQVAGTYHVLAISGGNIAMLAGLFLAVLRLGRVGAPAAELTAAGLLVVYAWAVGGGASVSRATTMAVTMLAAFAMDHRGHPVNGLGVAAGLGLAVQPLALFDPGAWLTFGATLAIVVGAACTRERAGQLPRWLQWAVGLGVASACAELALFPLTAFVFNQVTAAGLVLNFVAIPLMGIVQLAGLLTLAADAVVPSVASLAGLAAHHAAWGLVESARLVDLVPWVGRRVPAPGWPCLVVYYGAWAGLIGLGRMSSARGGALRWGRMACAGAAAASGVWVLVAPVWPATPPRGLLRATIIDVGQGDAAVVQCPTGDVLMVDAGGAGGSRFDIGRRVIEPAIWAAGIRRLAVLVLTHADADHTNGAAAVLRDLRPAEVWEGVPVAGDAVRATLRDAAAAAGVRWRIVQRGDRVDLGGVTVRTWHPPPADWERQRVRNDDSVVTEIRYGDVSLVLAGDVEAAGESAVVAAADAAPLRILMAPHHGSATSSGEAFLRRLAPAAGLISVGRGNRYGHPHGAALARWRALGVPVFRTDRDGAVTVTTDGREVRITSFTGRALTLPARSAQPR